MLRRLLVAALVLDGAILVFACGDPSHIYQGRAWIEGRQCLGTTSSVDVVEGEQAKSCGPTCLTQPHPDGGRSLYVSTMCAPYPFMFDAAGADPQCAPALAALARNDTCNADGTSSNPVEAGPPPADAAPE